MVAPSLTFRKCRRGTVAPLTALLLIVLVGMVGFAVDLGYIVVVRTEAQSAADAAALAGVAKLFSREVFKTTGVNAGVPLQTSLDLQAARLEAKHFAMLNKVGGMNAELLDEDIEIGYLANPYDHSRFNQSGELDTSGWPDRPYNAVRVRIRRDAAHGGSLSLFFGRLLGRDRADIMATATAVFEMDGIQGFRIFPGQPLKSKLLPFAMKLEAWEAVMKATKTGTVELSDGTTVEITDNFTSDPDRNDSTGVTKGADGVLEVQLYPDRNSGGKGQSGLTPGNFGTLDIGYHNNSTSDIKRQILEGPNEADFAAIGGELVATPQNPKVLQGDTGLSLGFEDELNLVKGQGRVIPIYAEVKNPGNTAEFTIVGFAGVTIVAVDLTGSNKYVTIQPRFVTDPTAKVRPGEYVNTVFVARGLQLVR